MAGFGQRDKSTFTRQQQLADRPRVSVCPGCRSAPRGHSVGAYPRGSSCQGNGTREGESSLFPACPCCQPTGHTQERSPSPNTVGKGCQHCRAECLEVWRCLSRGCLCSLSSSTPEALFFCPAGQDGSCSLNQLLFLHLLHAVLVLLVPFLYFLGGTSNPDLETKLSMDFMVLSLTLVVYELLRLGSHLQNPRNPIQAGIIDLTLQTSRHRYLHTF